MQKIFNLLFILKKVFYFCFFSAFLFWFWFLNTFLLFFVNAGAASAYSDSESDDVSDS